MKKLICITVLLGFDFLLFAQNDFAQKAHDALAFQSLVDTERAFSKKSEEKGIRPAFMAFIADDGILFRPTAVKGKLWMTEHPLPVSEKRPWLSWQPVFADVARAGDMGYTTGPWQYKDDIHDAKPTAFGNFVTVWKKRADGSWKFAIDLGVSHPEPTEAAVPWQAKASPVKKSKKLVSKGLAESWTWTLLNLDAEFSRASETEGAVKAFLNYAADEIRLFRNNSFPFVGRHSATGALPANHIWTWKPEFADISHSGDLGYTYGTYELRSQDTGESLTEKGNYLRIWKQQNGKWQVVVDVADPLPEPKKN